ncbi:MAG TPA: VOC family protein [Streptomyces sp.]|uniref:VOC family protein n=1 Tax=Streptomyces sp. TaxID=1931 RepID=UPI002CF1BBA8|nr:VOC family protein [Streptomyces sp.]HWU06139.1 VOC family protein [Streptomyces sp.]
MVRPRRTATTGTTSTPDGVHIAVQGTPDHRPSVRLRSDRDPLREHLDSDAVDIDRAQREVPALGATPPGFDGRDGEPGFRVYAGPAGHPFRPFVR